MSTVTIRAPSSQLKAPSYDEAAKRVPDYRLPATDYQTSHVSSAYRLHPRGVLRQVEKFNFSNQKARPFHRAIHASRFLIAKQLLLYSVYWLLIGTTARVFPSGANTLRMVSSCGLVIPFSILAMIGCFTPLSSSSFFWLNPFSCLALISSPIRATLRLLSATSSGVKSVSIYSKASLPIALFILFAPFYQVCKLPLCFFYLPCWCFLRFLHKLV